MKKQQKYICPACKSERIALRSEQLYSSVINANTGKVIERRKREETISYQYSCLDCDWIGGLYGYGADLYAGNCKEHPHVLEIEETLRT